ncbi:MAG TPA: 7-carboxy-7-deazaguanine synthase QueE [Bacteroidales bacterium]|nr:7-carboxy-7-deazaguanine synthase QueE [Bacteroidales bacterium]
MIDPVTGNSENKLPLVEQFYSIQGEGYHAGKAAYFLRIGGCDVGCNWCDSKFAWNNDLHMLTEIGEIVKNVLESGADSVVVTGGEPLMWNLDKLCREFKGNSIGTFLETSGAYNLSGEWDWICLSPKRNMPPVGGIESLAGELKIIIEKAEDFIWAEQCRSKVKKDCKLYLQPEWSSFNKVMDSIVEYIKLNTEWSVSLQSHKYMRIP